MKARNWLLLVAGCVVVLALLRIIGVTPSVFRPKPPAKQLVALPQVQKPDSLTAWQMNHPYPRLANYFLTETLSLEEADKLAKWPVVVTGWEIEYNSAEAFQRLNQLNPSIVLVPYLASNELTLKNSEAAPYDTLLKSLEESDWLYTPTGEHARFWPGCWTYNLTRRATAEKLLRFVSLKLSSDWDGVFWDNIWNEVSWYNQGQVDADRNGQPDEMFEFNRQWRRNELFLIGQSRLRLGPKKLVLANVGGGNLGEWLLNGRMFERFPHCYGDTTEAGLNRLLADYQAMCEDAFPPAITIVNAEGSENDLRLVRFGLTFTLMADGYFSYDTGPTFHHCLWWYDMYYQPIGFPLAPAEHDATGVWLRQFGTSNQPTIVFWNPTNATHVFELGFPDGTIREITVPARDGLILRTAQAPAS